jgi:hypothetical protein
MKGKKKGRTKGKKKKGDKRKKEGKNGHIELI